MSDASSEMHPLFVSYASGDQARVELIAAALSEADLPIWIDRDGIAGGSSYGSEIANAIRQAPAVLLCLTPAALASRNVRREIALAWKHERPIIPLLLEPTEIPPDLEYWLEATQWIEVLRLSPTEWMPRLTNALSGHGVFMNAVAGEARRAMRLTPARSNLPLLPPEVIGRELEITEVVNLLRSGTRLLTLTGPGGVGKTTLAIAAAQTLTDNFPDGIYFVDLAPVRAIDNAIPTIAQVIGIRELGIESAAHDLADYLSGKRALLIFDNTEHLDGIENSIEDLLRGAREMTALVTSRRPLHVRGEREMLIHTLPVALSSSDLTDIGTFPAVRLFLSLAAQSAPGLTLDEANATTIATICDRLDGLPLAIELAAARLRLFSPAVLLEKLDHGLDVLGGDAAHGSGRQRTLGDTVAWSVNLLSPAERALFRRLAVFVGGFTWSAAEAVVISPTGQFREEIDLLAGIDSLVDNSLVTRQMRTDGDVRFGMLATIYDIARRSLEKSEEVSEIRDRHARWCERYSAEIALLVLDFTTVSMFPNVAYHLPNFRAALWWLSQTGDDTTYKWIASNLSVLWEVLDGREIESILLKAPKRDETADPRLRAHFLRALLQFPAAWLADDDAQHEKFDELQTMYDQLGDRFGKAYAHYQHSAVYARSDEWAAANRELDLAIATWQQIDQKDWIAFSFVRKGAIAFFAGDANGAAEWIAKALTFYDQPYTTYEVDFALLWKVIIDAPTSAIEDGCKLLLATLQDSRATGVNSHLTGWAGTACSYLLLHGNPLGRQMIDDVIRIQDAMGFYYEYLMPDPRRIKKLAGIRDEFEPRGEVLTTVQIVDLLESKLRELAQMPPRSVELSTK